MDNGFDQGVLVIQQRQMSQSPHKLDSTYYKSNRTPDLDLIKRQIHQLRLEEKPRQHSRLESRHRSEDLERRVEIVLRQNSTLLTENAELAQLLAQKTLQIEVLQSREERGKGFGEQAVLLEMEKREHRHIVQVQQLVQEVKSLSEEYSILESLKAKQIQVLKEDFGRQAFDQVTSLRRSQASSIGMHEEQIRRLKGELELARQKQEELVRENRNIGLKLEGQKYEANNGLKHLGKIQDLEVEEIKMRYDSELDSLRRELAVEREEREGTSMSNTRKVMKELSQAKAEVGQLNSKIIETLEEARAETLELETQIRHLRVENQLLEGKYKEEMATLRSKAQEMFRKESSNAMATRDLQMESLRSEISKLYEVSLNKTSEVEFLRTHSISERDIQRQARSSLEGQNQELRRKLGEMELEHKTEVEILKIKVSELHYSQVEHLQKYMQREVSVLTEQVINQEGMIEGNRAQIHQEMQDKDSLRKYYEVELSKERSKAIDLRVKLAAVTVEMKQQMVSLTSKLELTSQTLIREADLKQRGQTFAEEEKRKLQLLINCKDNEILMLNEQLNALKKDHIMETTQLQDYLRSLKSINEDLEETQKTEEEFYQGELQRRQAKNQQEVEALQKQLSELRTEQRLNIKEEMETLQKENIVVRKQLDKLTQSLLTKTQEMNEKNGFIESMQLESQAALQQEGNKYRVYVSNNQVTLKTFFEEKVSSKNKEIVSLKAQLAEKDKDLRDVIAKYKALEGRLEVALESIEKLSDLENRVLNLGMDNNLIKNLGELLKHTT